MWLLLINKVPENVRSLLQARGPQIEQNGDYLLRVFADDISAAVMGSGAQGAFTSQDINSSTARDRSCTQPGEA